MRVALFITCLTDTLFPDTGQAMVEVLERLGHEVVFPQEQTCCGQMHANNGYRVEAMPLLERFVEIFEDPSFDAIVSPSGSCVAMVREQYPRLARRAKDSSLQDRVDALTPRVFEFAEFLVDRLEVEDVGAYYPHRVTYHPSCHSLRVLKASDAAVRLLRAVRGIDLVQLPQATVCCGFGGTFSVKNPETSSAMLADKLRAILDTGAEVCTATDNSCLMHIWGGLARQQTGVDTVHLAQILNSRAAA
jgi:L-lactate dehydrogenase complex protein LldE